MKKNLMELSVLGSGLFFVTLMTFLCARASYDFVVGFSDFVKEKNLELYSNNEGIVILCSFFMGIWMLNIVAKPFLLDIQKNVTDYRYKEKKEVTDDDGHTKTNVEKC